MRASLGRIAAVCVKEVIQLSRDRVTFAMVVAMPLVMLVIFGYAINTDVRHVSTALVDNAGNAFARQFARDLQATQVIRITHSVASVGELEQLIRRGEVLAGIIIPADVARRYYSGQPPVAQLVVDASDTLVAGAVNQLRQFPVGATAGGVQGSLSVRLLYNPERRAPVLIVPGLTAIILTMTMVLFTAIALVRERESGSFELLAASPLSNFELMVGKILPYIVIGLIQMVIILAVGDLLFGVPFSNGVDVLIASVIFIIACLSLGLLISSVAPSQLAAMQIFIFFMLPSILLSGFIFPYISMPLIFQYLAELLPATHFMRIIRGLLLRGASLAEVAADVWFLAGFSVLMMALAIRLFRKRLD